MNCNCCGKAVPSKLYNTFWALRKFGMYGGQEMRSELAKNKVGCMMCFANGNIEPYEHTEEDKEYYQQFLRLMKSRIGCNNDHEIDDDEEDCSEDEDGDERIVSIQGLVSRLDLNGEKAIVKETLANGRLKIEVLTSKECVSIKLENVVDEAEDGSKI